MASSRRFPLLTAIVVTAAVAAAVMQYAFAATVPALERDLDALRAGEWWRAATPLLVQTLGWYQVAANLVTLALFGLIAERVVGRWRWWILFAAGALGGQILAYALHEPGGGDSIAVCGLAGGVAVVLLAHRWPAPPWFAAAVVVYVAALAGWGLGGPITAALAATCGSAAIAGLRVAAIHAGDRIALAGALLAAAAMTAAGDLHGVALLAGATTMVALLVIDRLSSGSPRANTHTDAYGTGKVRIR